MGVDSGLYKVILLVHILAVVAGFGPLVWNSTDAVQVRRAQVAIYAVPVLGIVLVLLSDELWGFDQLWITLAFVLYIVLLAAFVVVLLPAMRQGDSRRAAMGSGVANLTMIAILALMIWKPGV